MNVFTKNLQILYKEGQLTPTLIKRMARMDFMFGDISEDEYNDFMEWIDEQEESKKMEEETLLEGLKGNKEVE